MLSRRALIPAALALSVTPVLAKPHVHEPQVLGDPRPKPEDDTKQFLEARKAELEPWLFMWAPDLLERGVTDAKLAADIAVTELGLVFTLQADNTRVSALIVTEALHQPTYRKTFRHLMLDVADGMAARYKMLHAPDKPEKPGETL